MKMINDKRELNWGMIGLLSLNAFFWFSVFTWGFFISLMWTIVGAAIVGLWLRLSGRA